MGTLAFITYLLIPPIAVVVCVDGVVHNDFPRLHFILLGFILGGRLHGGNGNVDGVILHPVSVVCPGHVQNLTKKQSTYSIYFIKHVFYNKIFFYNTDNSNLFSEWSMTLWFKEHDKISILQHSYNLNIIKYKLKAVHDRNCLQFTSSWCS